MFALIISGLLATSATAGGKSSISLAGAFSTSTATSLTPHYGNSVWFAVQTNEQTPYVNLQCTQGTTLVYASTRAYWASYDRTFTLSQPLDSFGFGWTGGGADCTASLWRFGVGAKLLAQTKFSVLP